MSMNKYMHPRNIYKHPPNFKDLALQYPEFRQHVKQDITGKVTLDFKNIDALRALTRVLLMKDFDLNVEIPMNKLIPTIPLRLNYLLWIEDMLSTHKLNLEEVLGVDIGTGASCVYPLMAASKFNWKMIGIEIDQESIKCARNNITQNYLNDKIEIFEATGNTLFKEIIEERGKIFQFSMCNPPFFSSTQELHPFFKSRKSNRPHPKNAFCASTDEVVAHGGEVEFISKLIKESYLLKDKIKIFTTMIGHKSNLNPLKILLREIQVCSFKQTEFCQGNTTRWGLAWTFFDLDLRAVPVLLKSSKVKPKPPLTFIIPSSENGSCSIHDVNADILKLFEELLLDVQEFKKDKNLFVYDVKAHSNTWSNQRRKRREKLQNIHGKPPIHEESDNVMDISTKSEEDSSTELVQCTGTDTATASSENDLQNASIRLSGMDISSLTPKREHEEDEDECYYNKRIKECVKDNNWLAKFFLTLKKNKKEENIILELFSVDSQTNREHLHQILQYIKNNFHKN